MLREKKKSKVHRLANKKENESIAGNFGRYLERRYLEEAPNYTLAFPTCRRIGRGEGEDINDTFPMIPTNCY